MKRDLLIISVAALVALSWWFFETNNESQLVPQVETAGSVHRVVLTEEGFVPQELSVALGDTVEFSTETKRPFWPASNLHPSHRDYPEFDPREPILSGETWSFTFTKPGTWKFHDHLAPYYSGVIMVSE